ncbi:uncharacterized protein LOC117152964 [Anabas testudineus]|uniref:uncharacterized protein LOC117152964 n=1 Tax=Anabas testudineus TaxID=64144 RepID=UPI00143D5536|nr:uncharacterized protein LOC117152964 [Anabas testudineus]
MAKFPPPDKFDFSLPELWPDWKTQFHRCCNKGFWQIPLDKDSAKLTTFITPFGRYYFNRLPFGISSAPEIFQREMNNLLKDHEGVAAFMHDIIIYGKMSAEPDQRLKKVQNTLEKAGLRPQQKV